MIRLRSLLFVLLVLILALPAAAPAAATAEATVANPRISGSLIFALNGLRISPDGRHAIFTSDLDGGNLLYITPTDGSAEPLQLSPMLDEKSEIRGLEFSPGGDRVVYTYGDPDQQGPRDLYSVPAGGGEPVLLNDVPGGVDYFAISPDGSRVVYRGRLSASGEFAIFSVPIGGGAPTLLSTPTVAGGGVKRWFEIGPNGDRVFYLGELEQPGVTELYQSQIDSPGATRLSADLVAGGQVSGFAISPAQSHVIYLADQEVVGRNELYSVGLSPAGAGAPAVAEPTRLNGPLVEGGAVLKYQFSPDGAAVGYMTNADTPGQHALYRAPVGGGEPTRLSGDGDVRYLPTFAAQSHFAFSPDGAWVIYQGSELSGGAYELLAVTADGAHRVRLSGEMVAGGEVSYFAVSPNGGRVVYQADQEQDETPELYSAPLPTLPGPAPAGADAVTAPPTGWVKLSNPALDGGWVSLVSISPLGDRVIYTASEDVNSYRQIYSVPIAGGAATRLNGPLVAGGSVRGYQITGDGSRVIYIADQDVDNERGLYAAYEAVPSATIAGPAGVPIPSGAHAVTVSLSSAPMLGGAEVSLAATGNAVFGSDYRLSSSPSRQGTVAAVGLLPGETSTTVTLEVLANPARTTPRTLELAIAPGAGVSPGEPSTLELSLAPYEARVYLPLTVR